MIPSDAGIEAAHINLHINQENTSNLVFSVLGHISGVDPTTNKIKVVIPTWTNDNNTYMESGWVPLGTAVAGNQYGIQLLPYGGATVTDPTGQNNSQNGNMPAAEQVLVHVLGRKKGFYVVGVQMFNTVDVPPSGYQDKSTVTAQAGEWLFKHASGSFMYFTNQGSIELNSFTNPSPVLQSNQTPDSVEQLINIVADADGSNVSGTPNTVSAQLQRSAIAMNGNTNNAISNEVVQSNEQGMAIKTTMIQADATQGTGTYTVTIQSNQSTMTIDINGNDNTYNLNVTNGTVNIKADTINLGEGTYKRLLNDVTAQLLNGHTHGGVQSGSDESGPMTQQIDSDHECQNVYGS